ncbi:uncharacterized protein Dana_GF13704 [Drosophila ananassae]|uniref:Uncharacterized protein n=1 Tax=Drosophila ananassae TaxID=7217 RepID=B3MHC5_DROAN|nr:uncharacterized protein LOC6496540 [Drosophila ananassae]EDV37925.1 uncharacterized protein Dana_GF13704 [Drosophila ananassae]
MTSFLLRFLWPLALLQCILARVPQNSRFYGQDSAIIIDTDMKMPPKMGSKLQNALYYNLPVYRMIKQTTTTTTAAPATNFQYPKDLVDLARNRLGLKVLPSLEELEELIGTTTREETISYIRNLTADEAGIALMKEYLATLNFEDQEVADDKDAVDEGDSADDDDNAMDNDGYEDAPKEPQTTSSVTTTSPDPQNSLYQRFSGFMKQYNLWSSDSTTTSAPAPAIPPPPAVVFKPVFVAPSVNRLRPLLVRQPLPYHYPIPLRPVMMPTVKPTEVPSTTVAPKPHLNTPKKIEEVQEVEAEVTSPPVPPHIRQLAEMANISPQTLDRFLQQQPKLAQLAKRVSTLALSQEQTKAMDTQVFMAIQKALSQNEELKRLIEAAQTLK